MFIINKFTSYINNHLQFISLQKKSDTPYDLDPLPIELKAQLRFKAFVYKYIAKPLTKVINVVSTIFGQSYTNRAIFLNKVITHTFENEFHYLPFTPPLPRLNRAINAIEQHVLNDNLHLKKFNELKTSLNNFVLYTSSKCYKYKEDFIVKFSTDGCCNDLSYGMSLIFARNALKVQEKITQDHLSKITQEFKAGADIEASGVQLYKDALNLFWENLQKTQPNSSLLEILEVTNQLANKKGLSLTGKNTKLLFMPFLSFSTITDPVINRQNFIESIQSKENGIYIVETVLNHSTSHTMTYIKTDEGNYIFDPNYGLMSCHLDGVKEAFNKVFSCYYPLETNCSVKLTTVTL